MCAQQGDVGVQHVHAVSTAGMMEQVQAGHVGNRGTLAGALVTVQTRVIPRETVLQFITSLLDMDVHEGIVFVADTLDVAKSIIVIEVGRVRTNAIVNERERVVGLL